MSRLTLILSLVSLATFFFYLYGWQWLLRVGRRRLRAGDLDGALRIFRRAVWLSRGAAPWLGIAAVHERAGRPAEALAALDRALEREPTNMEVFDARVDAEVARAKGDRAPVIEWLHARANDSRLGAVPRMLAKAQRAIWLAADPARRAEAIVDLEACWRLVADADIGLALARAHIAAGAPALALPYLRQVANMAEEHAAIALLEMMQLGGDDPEVAKARVWAAGEAAGLRGDSHMGGLVALLARAQGGDAEAKALLGKAIEAVGAQRARLPASIRRAVDAVLGPVPEAEAKPDANGEAEPEAEAKPEAEIQSVMKRTLADTGARLVRAWLTAAPSSS